MNYKEKVNSGLCGSCGVRNTNGYGLCDSCRKVKSRNRKNAKNRRLSEGRCISCGKKAGKRLCKTCRATASEYERKRSKKIRDECRKNGCCIRCGGAASHNLCETCSMKRLAWRVFKDLSKWHALKTMFDLQSGKCAYSGMPLEIGVNAHLDHKHPKSKGGSNEMDNLHWVDKNVNLMKRDFEESVFLELVKKISEHVLRV